MKRPSFQFYPADWRKDAALQSCSIAAQGLWVNIMCIAHECEPYGYLMVNGKPMTPPQLARLVGLSDKECRKLLGELSDAGVSSADEQGAIYSRRMVRDEDIRNRRAAGGKEGAEHGAKGAEHGSKGGRPKVSKGGLETPLPGEISPPKEPPPSSSSSSSPSGDRGEPPPEKRKRAPAKAPFPDGFALTDELRAYAVKHLPDVDPPALFESFRGKALAKGWTYANWAQALQEFIRNAAPNSGHFGSGQYPRKPSDAEGMRFADGREVRW